MIDEKSKDLLSFFEAVVDRLYVINEGFVVEYMSGSMIEQFGGFVGKKCHQVLHHSDEICPWCRARDTNNCFQKETLGRIMSTINSRPPGLSTR